MTRFSIVQETSDNCSKGFQENLKEVLSYIYARGVSILHTLEQSERSSEETSVQSTRLCYQHIAFRFHDIKKTKLFFGQ